MACSGLQFGGQFHSMSKIEKAVFIARIGVIIPLAYMALVIALAAAEGLYRSILEDELYQTLLEMFEDLGWPVVLLLWNLSPLAAAYFILKGAEERKGWASVAFAAGVILCTLYLQSYYTLAYFGFVRVSSTEVLGFFIYPMLQFAVASILGATVMLIIAGGAAAKAYFLKRR
jgi:hypothetical protein